MMDDIKLIDVRKEIFAENDESASEIRKLLQEKGSCMINLMGSPGCGKTSFLLQTIKHLEGKRHCCRRRRS